MQNNNSLPNYLKFFKIAFLIAVILVFVSSIIYFFFGFNKGFDLKGGTQLVVSFELSDIDISNEKDFEKASNDVKSILDKNNISVNSFQVLGKYDSQNFVITFDNISDEELEKVRIEINENFSASFASLTDEEQVNTLGKLEDLTRKTTVVGSLIDYNLVMITISALIFLLSIACIYACFRFKVGGALTIVFGLVFDLVVFLSLIILFRVEVNRYIFAVCSLIYALSLYSSVSMMLEIKSLAKEPNNSNLSNADIANLYISKTWKTTFLKYVIAFAFSLVLCLVLIPNVIYTSLACFVGFVVLFASHLLILPAFWAFINVKKETFTKQGIVRTNVVEKKVASTQNEILENNNDEDAEVIEIKE